MARKSTKKAARKSTRKFTKPRRSQADMYQEITDRIVSAMEADGVAPWRKPWKPVPGMSGAPRNVRGNEYRGINVWLTMITAWERGYQHNVWLTFGQANELAAKAAKAAGREVRQNDRGTWVFADGDPMAPDGAGKSCGGVRKGQNKANGCGATSIVFWKKIGYTVEGDDGEEEKRQGMLLRFYSVFNLQQCDDAVIAYVVGQQKTKAAKLPEFKPIKRCEQICKGFDVKTKHDGGSRAFYRPATDEIHLPTKRSFDSPEHYYTTRFHEMGHATGAVHRLNRKGIAGFDFFGSHQYSEEELVAEFTACYLSAEAGIERTTEDNSVSYLKVWAKKLKEDPKLVVMAAQRAQKAADLILGREFAESAGEEEAA